MKISITKASPEHTEAISRICASGWLQTVKGKYSEEYQKKTVDYWYNHQKGSMMILSMGSIPTSSLWMEKWPEQLAAS